LFACVPHLNVFLNLFDDNKPSRKDDKDGHDYLKNINYEIFDKISLITITLMKLEVIFQFGIVDKSFGTSFKSTTKFGFFMVHTVSCQVLLRCK
jgi:hypothetical protein